MMGVILKTVITIFTVQISNTTNKVLRFSIQIKN